MNQSIYRVGSEVKWYNPFQNRVVRGVVVKVYSGKADSPHIIINWERGANPILPLMQFWGAESEEERIRRQQLKHERRREYFNHWQRKKRAQMLEKCTS